MTARELLRTLQEFPEEDLDRLVVLSSDEEGNGYKPMTEVWDTARYDPKEHEVGLESLSNDDIEHGYEEEDVMKHGVPAMVFYP